MTRRKREARRKFRKLPEGDDDVNQRMANGDDRAD